MGVHRCSDIPSSHNQAYACREARASNPIFSTQKPPLRRSRRALIQAVVTGSSKTERKLREPDGSFGLPLLGESLEWVKDLSHFFAERHVLFLVAWLDGLSSGLMDWLGGMSSSTVFAPAVPCL